MMYLAMGLFTLAAVLGLSILIKWLTKKEASRVVVYSHGIVAAVALVLLVAFSVQNPASFPKAALTLFLLAALGGFYMFYLDLKKKFSPIAVAVIHALLAVSGLLTLLIFVFA